MISYIFIVLLISALISGVLLRRILLFAFKNNIFDKIDIRKIHLGNTPRLGGCAFFPSMIITLFLVELYFGLTKDLNVGIDDKLLSPEMLTLFFACLLCFVFNIVDDIISIGYRQKFINQFVCGVLIVAYGPKIDNLCGIINIYTLSPSVSFLLSVFVVMYIINSMNLIDGIDGLAASISAMALLYYGCVFVYLKKYEYAFAAYSMLGTLIPFLKYNIRGFKNNYKIFMGDTGSASLGLFLAFLGLSLYDKLSPNDGNYYGNILVLAFTPVIIPCLDVVRVMFFRIKTHKNPFKPDKNHIHHRLLSLGLSQHQCLLILLIINIFYFAVNVLLSDMNINLIIAIDVLLYAFMNMVLSWKIKQLSIKTN